MVYDRGATMLAMSPFCVHSPVHSSWIATLWFWEIPFGVAPVAPMSLLLLHLFAMEASGVGSFLQDGTVFR